MTTKRAKAERLADRTMAAMVRLKVNVKDMDALLKKIDTEVEKVKVSRIQILLIVLEGLTSVSWEGLTRLTKH